MSKPKHKWTSEEEAALKTGVRKHKEGNWKGILEDTQLGSILANRTNVNLKDKWRNLYGNNFGSSSRGNARTSCVPVTDDRLVTSPEPYRSSLDKSKAPPYKAMIYESLSYIDDPIGADIKTMVNYLESKYVLQENFERSFPANLRKLVATGKLEKVNNRYKIKGMSSGSGTSQQAVTDDILITSPEPYRSPLDKSKAPPYKAMIYESLSYIDNPNGTDVNTMVNYLKSKYVLQENFERSFPANLRKLVANGNLEKVNNRYKVKGMPSGAGTSQLAVVRINNVDNGYKAPVEPLLTETLEDAASVAAFQVAVAETKAYKVADSWNDKDMLDKLLYESTTMLTIAEELHERCEKHGSTTLRP